MKFYIAGPMAFKEDNNREAFERMEKRLIELGYEVLTPLKNGLPTDAHRKFHMKADIQLLLQANAVMMLKGWQDSHGARLEHGIAQEIGLQIFKEESTDWL